MNPPHGKPARVPLWPVFLLATLNSFAPDIGVRKGSFDAEFGDCSQSLMARRVMNRKLFVNRCGIVSRVPDHALELMPIDKKASEL
jgi:hypothetical protein